jgi:hypothetical protein
MSLGGSQRQVKRRRPASVLLLSVVKLEADESRIGP